MRTLRVRLNELAIHFINVNTQMALRGHSHFATVSLEYETTYGPAPLGFPSFHDTNNAVHDILLEATAAPLRDFTNEQVAMMLFDRASEVDRLNAAVAQWKTDEFRLCRLELNVRGIRDSLGHADGFTTYIVEDRP